MFEELAVQTLQSLQCKPNEFELPNELQSNAVLTDIER